MKVEDIATELFLELGEPSNLSIPSISYYIRANIGRLNNLLFEDFYIEETSGQYQIWDGDATEISPEAASVIQSMFRVHEYGLAVRSTLNALANDSIVEFTDNLQGSTVRKSDRNTTSKTYVSLKAAEQENLNDLIGAYRMRENQPSQVAGNDDVIGTYNPEYPYTFRNWRDG